jgi:hypothetical protein
MSFGAYLRLERRKLPLLAGRTTVVRSTDWRFHELALHVEPRLVPELRWKHGRRREAREKARERRGSSRH